MIDFDRLRSTRLCLSSSVSASSFAAFAPAPPLTTALFLPPSYFFVDSMAPPSRKAWLNCCFCAPADVGGLLVRLLNVTVFQSWSPMRASTCSC
eukprot:CAMPEP_0119412396 /NCGR_PEP_ID=MMETSP1335-20130426/4858_1 /TAXON_ID=259385 /ORGANISM="Chrysoculter rhomboideus, Strain RCC1486" /LENGTH=93 /DNA_ID=CAMNT_0007437129 /DNA_START=349 /DNA_END=630 /DNA_ORIENTATION=-